MDGKVLAKVGKALAGLIEESQKGKDGLIRAEEALSAGAAVTGQLCIEAAGEFDPDNHDYPPGSPVLSHKVNQLLSADQHTWADAAGRGALGHIHDGALLLGYEEEDFPELEAVFETLVTGRIARNDAAAWGRAPLSVPFENRPSKTPLQAGYELRGGVRQYLQQQQGIQSAADRLQTCATALAFILDDVKDAIDRKIAARIALETVNGMAKMAPMTARHMAEAAKAARE